MTETQSLAEKPIRQRLELSLASLYPITIDEANDFLEQVGHKLGPVYRPFRQEAYGFTLDGHLIAVAISGSIVHGPVAGFEMQEVVELTRLAATEKWMSRVMLRLWREIAAPRWKCWPVRAAVSYSHNTMHRGDIYRFDGWTKVRDDAGSSGGGTWSRKRKNSDAVFGKKTLWLWRYE